MNHDRALITIGRFPLLSLSEARTEAKKLLAEFTLGRTRPQSLTYAQAVQLFLDDKAKAKRARTVKDYKRLLNRVSFTGKVSEINHAETARKLAKFKAPSEHAHLTVALRIFFNWCMKRQYITYNPTIGVSTQPIGRRSRILSDDELKVLWLVCEQCGKFGLIVRLLILTGQRCGEIAALRTSFIEGTTITLPDTLTKNRREHTFPMATLAAHILRGIEVDTKRNDALFFPARGKSDKPFNGWSKSMKALRGALGDFKHFTLHDLRRT